MIICDINPTGLTAFIAGSLVALDKCPGARPVGIGEVVRRIARMAILSVTRMVVYRGPTPTSVLGTAGRI